MPKEKTHHVPAEMSDEALRRYYPELGAGTVRLPLEDLYPLLGRLAQALKTDPGHNPDGLTIDDFRWAHVKTLSGNVTEQLCAESVKTGRVHSGDTELIPAPEGQFWAYMGELTALSK